MNHAVLTRNGRFVILAVAFLGWLSSGVLMSIIQLAGQAAATDLLTNADGFDPSALTGKELIARWFAWYQCAFLFGAATGGLVFGWLGDRLGRARGMSLSILTFSGMSVVASYSQSPAQLLIAWFLACLGVGGMWPNGVALVSEAWSSMSRPVVAGVLGTSANIGLFLMATLAAQKAITPADWRWSVIAGGLPIVLGVFALFAVPESPRWLAAKAAPLQNGPEPVSAWEVFRPPLLRITLTGIALATIPMIGGWGSANWMIPWADKAGLAADPPDPFLKAYVGQARSITGIVGSLLGGWIAFYAGRRRTYFLVSLGSLLTAQYTFWQVFPTDVSFLYWVALLGFFNGVYFGWMPLFLPELFPTRIRSTGSGVSFNFGRILTAATVFATGSLMTLFDGDYARLGRATSLFFAVGMLIILFCPDTSGRSLED